jgi:hypothetical protein
VAEVGAVWSLSEKCLSWYSCETASNPG